MELKSILNGKVAFITGSTRGIGWATARNFAKHGATVIINGHSARTLLDERVSTIRGEFGVECLGIFCDVTQPEQVRDCYQQIFKTYKRLDILVNNAGILQDALIGMISEEAIRATFAVNVLGALYNIQEGSRLMRRNLGGSIINVSSVIGVRGNEGQLAYAGSKSAVIGFTLSAAKELAKYDIRVNAVAPGLVDTEMIKHLPEDKLERLRSAIGMGRIGLPDDVANVMLFFASDLSAYVTGQVLCVDGGMLV